MSLHKEIEFENDIVGDMSQNGWLYNSEDSSRYDRAKALYLDDVVEWITATQPKAWEAIQQSHGMQALDVLARRIRDQIDQRGTLDVIRHGVEMMGLRKKIEMAQFKPALAMNPDIVARYQQNRLRVVRQCKYSTANENCIDLVLFLNGIPVATVELKSDFTQSVNDAVDQYRFDRQPRPKGQSPEPLLSFPNGALIHFAVSNSEVMMTTKLDGPATIFLPFNQGHEGGAGNPLNPNGYRTAYLWKEIWERESWLEIIGRYLVTKRNEKKQITNLIFPRYHQLDATRKIQATIAREGAGGKFLIQHSAGSGKTNSIAWTAHFLADLHDAEHKKIFNSVIVVSDRTVIDSQLQEAIYDFERTAGVVASIRGEAGSKSTELTDALGGAKKIVVCTIQTFPFALKKVREMASLEGKRFAVIADEAHSSQTGDAAAKLKTLLSPEEIEELKDGGEISSEVILAAQMSARAKEKGITYVAFTATPKSKTIELFGRMPFADKPKSKENLPEPFHVYSMRQAIDEGFILDVLQNYITYKLAFKLTHNGEEYDEKQVVRCEAMKGIMGWIRLHPFNISQKVQTVVEHFRKFIAPLLQGKAKAMVVVSSRVDAVRWQLAIRKYIESKGYTIQSMVAFSGEVNDAGSGPEPFAESSHAMNPNLRGRGIRDAFNTDEFQILLVANKFQTGFDQPLLCGMYVDKRLAGIQAVQTLSRLNRAYKGKKETYILDFVNESAEILEAFKTYYTTAELADVTNPDLIFNLRSKLDATGHYDDNEINRVVSVILNPKGTQRDLEVAITPVVDRLHKKYKEAKSAMLMAKEQSNDTEEKKQKDVMDSLKLFQTDMGSFTRLYTFLSQMFDYGNTDIEKRAIFYREVLRLLEFGREREGIDLSKLVLTHHTLRYKGKQSMALNEGDAPKLPPITESGSGQIQEKERALLNEIIKRVNELFQGELSDTDQLVYVNNVIKGKMLESEVLRQQALNNSKEQFDNSPDVMSELINATINSLDAHSTMSKQVLESEAVRLGIKEILLGPGRLWEILRQINAA